MLSICVITTVNKPTEAIKEISKNFPGRTIVVGDRKTPSDWYCHNVEFYSFQAQQRLPFWSTGSVAENHYSRKNLGYLLAISLGASVIYDTDDDNFPSSSWRQREEYCSADCVDTFGWCNVYALLRDGSIWPRGFPLQKLGVVSLCKTTSALSRCPIQQGLVDLEPDVDAIWRLLSSTRVNEEVLFDKQKSLVLGRDVWCPFNSQTTWWWPEAFLLMYLPKTAPFRMTDIWRSFIAQRCLWEVDCRVAFHSPSEVVQKRNLHNLLKDFEDEVPGYLKNEKIVEVLRKLSLKGSIESNLLVCYEALVSEGLLDEVELPSVRVWIKDVTRSLT